MEQINIPEQMKVEIDYERPGIPYTANLLQPVLFKDGSHYCCVLGPDIQKGIIGIGDTPEKAIQYWDSNLSERIQHSGKNDSVIKEVKAILHDHATGSKGADQPISSPLPAEAGEGGANDSTTRKYTADQNNTDGSEFR